MTARLPLFLIILCVVLAAGAVMLHRAYPAYDLPALLVANCIMLLLSLAAWAMHRRNVGKRPHGFVRGVQGASMLRLFVCMGGFLAYALLNRAHLHKPSLFLMFGIYAAYMVVETIAFSSTAKKVASPDA